jgi:hypothetical protein
MDAKSDSGAGYLRGDYFAIIIVNLPFQKSTTKEFEYEFI